MQEVHHQIFARFFVKTPFLPSPSSSLYSLQHGKGASGAGKSTFLDLLAGRKFDGEYAGQILQASGEASRGSSSRSEGGGRGRASVYVTQDDFHVAELTVRESLAFAVRLSMGVPGVT